MLIHREHMQLLLVDVQEKIVPVMHGWHAIENNIIRLLKSAQICQVPMTVVEHYRDGLGTTLPSLLAHTDSVPIAKTTFSAAATKAVKDAVIALAERGRTQIVVVGIEAHVCVLQTALAFQISGLDVFVVADAIASRKPESVAVALRRLEAARVTLCTTEMVMFEWIEDAKAPEFQALRKLLL